MASFNFTIPGAGSYTVSGPAGFTYEQAKKIFDDQQKAGSLVGFKPGDILNSATQLAAGLPSAASQLAQTLSGVPGVGATTLSTAAASVSAAVTKVTTVSKETFSNITNAIKQTSVTNGINVADYAKQMPALTSIQGLSPTSVTAGLSQASKLVGQAANQISTAGVGKFGLNIQQLESAGVVKPGTAATYTTVGNQLIEVLKSPAVYTGKNGINNLDDLLSSPAKQNGIQQQLMSGGLSAVKQFGLPTDKLSPGALLGTALNAAKSIPTTVDWAKGLPLPADVKSAFNQIARDGAFAADFAGQKVNDAMKQEIVPFPASDTVNRDTLNAASSRVIGNAKVPAVDYSSTPTVNVDKFANDYVAVKLDSTKLQTKLTEVMRNTTSADIPQSIRQREQVIGDFYVINSRALELIRLAKAIETQTGANLSQQVATLQQEREFITKLIASITAGVTALKQQLENSVA